MPTTPVESADEPAYTGLLESVAKAASGPVLFRTDAAGLFEAFLSHLPPHLQQHHNCHACRRFIESYGGLASVAPDGSLVPDVWRPEEISYPYAESVSALSRIVRRARVTGVFLAGKHDKPMGVPVTGPWRHMSCVPNARLCPRETALKNASQLAAEKLEEYGMLQRSLTEFRVEPCGEALRLLTDGQLYRSEKCVGVAKWLVELHQARAAAQSSRQKENLTWAAVATAPTGFCHVRGGMIGTLLEDIVAGLPFADIKRRFDTKMAPSVYQRAQAPPSEGSIAQAEKIIAEMKAAGSLARRYAKIEELPLKWRPSVSTPPAAPASEGVFSHLKAKAKATPAPAVDTPAQPITWEKFQRTVLPGAASVEVLVQPTSDRFMALVTAAVENTPPVLQWDNPFSWYYASGIDAEIKRRVTGAGGTYKNCDIRASLIWNNRNDLDIHAITPAQEHIYFGDKRARCGGWLDVDMNVSGETTKPVENIRWTRGTARPGLYRFFVQNYRFHEWDQSPTPFRVELEINGDVFQVNGVIGAGSWGPKSDVVVADIHYAPGVRIGALRGATPATAEPSSWGVRPGTWVKVTGILDSPNMWGAQPLEQHGYHSFLLLDGCRDASEGVGRGLFVETLRSEFRPVRSVLEAHMAVTPIAGKEEASACGIGFSKGTAPIDVTLRVGRSIYRLDRWD